MSKKRDGSSRIVVAMWRARLMMALNESVSYCDFQGERVFASRRAM